MMDSKLVLLLFISLILGILIDHFIIHNGFSYTLNYTFYKQQENKLTATLSHASPNLQIINVSDPTDGDFKCMATKVLLNHISTNICLYDAQKDVYVSTSFRGTESIWEEEGVTRILKLLLRHPNLDFIDIGANIGTYTMYAASLGRFVLAIDCFAPNINRIHRAAQLANVANRVVLVQNAIFTQSGQLLGLSDDATNVGGQEIDVSMNQTHNQSTKGDPYIVKTIRLDEVVPILIARGVRGAIMKVDIEGTESFVVESGSQIFDTFDIPFVQMEWLKVRHYPARVQVILDFFAERNYDPRTFSCDLLNPVQHMTWPVDMCWIKRNVSNFC